MDKPKLALLVQDGNAFAILGQARKVAIANKMDWDAIQKEATSGDYDHLLQTIMKHFDVGGDDGDDDEWDDNDDEIDEEDPDKDDDYSDNDIE